MRNKTTCLSPDYSDAPKRFEKYGLTVHTDKTRLIRAIARGHLALFSNACYPAPSLPVDLESDPRLIVAEFAWAEAKMAAEEAVEMR